MPIRSGEKNCQSAFTFTYTNSVKALTSSFLSNSCTDTRGIIVHHWSFPLHCCLPSVKHLIGFSLFSVSYVKECKKISPKEFVVKLSQSSGVATDCELLSVQCPSSGWRARSWKYFLQGLHQALQTLAWPSMTFCMSSCRSCESSWDIAVATCRSRKSCHPAGSLPSRNLPHHRRFLRMVPLEHIHDEGTPRQGSCAEAKILCSPLHLHGFRTSELLSASKRVRRFVQWGPCRCRPQLAHWGHTGMPLWPNGWREQSCTSTLWRSSSAHSSHYNTPPPTPPFLGEKRRAKVSTCGRWTHKTGRNSPRLRLRHAAPPARHRSEQKELEGIPHPL